MTEGLRLERGTYFTARFLAQVSQNLFLAALFVVAGTSGHAGIGLGNLFVAMLLPAITLGMLGGAIADRLGPGPGYAVGSFLRFLSVVAGVAFIHDTLTAWIIALVYSTGSQVFSPAEMALVKVVDNKHAGRAHSFIVLLQTGGQVAGMLILAPALYFMGGPRLILVGSSGGYAVLTLFAIFLAVRCGSPTPNPTSGRTFAFRQTFAYFRAEPRARDAVATLALKVVTARSIMVAIPFYLKYDMRVGQEFIAYLLVPGAIGAGAGLLWASRTLSLEMAPRIMRLSVIGFAVGAFALAVFDYTLSLAVTHTPIAGIPGLQPYLNTTFIVALPVAFLLGASMSGAMVSARVALTETAPLEQQSRVFASQLWLTETLIVLPLALAGLGTEFAGARPTLAAVAVLALGTYAVMDSGRLRALLPRLGTARTDAEMTPALAPIPVTQDRP
jgi:hypothetical protein